MLEVKPLDKGFNFLIFCSPPEIPNEILISTKPGHKS